MPRIGKRILKSSLAVFLCFLIYLLRNEEGIVFYSCIAAVLCMQQDTSHTQRVAANRVVGTLVGGFCGMLVLLFEKHILPGNTQLMQYALISFMIIPVIYITVLLKKTSASYISCVVFMSVTVSHGADVNPYLFAINRMIDTLIGIAVAYGINCIHLPVHLQKETLYVSTLDHTLLQENEQLSPYTRVKLRQLLEQGAAITLATSRTPATLLPILEGIPLTLPVVVMNGAALYDCRTQTYSHSRCMKKEQVAQLLQLLDEEGMNCFQHVILHHILHVYYSDFRNPLEEEYYHEMRRLPYKSYVYEQKAQAHACVCITIMDTIPRIQQLYTRMQQQSYAADLQIHIRFSEEHQGYKVLDIYSVDATKQAAVHIIQIESGFERLCVFASHQRDAALISSADEAYTVSEGAADMQELCCVLGSRERDSVIREIERSYHGHRKRK